MRRSWRSLLILVLAINIAIISGVHHFALADSALSAVPSNSSVTLLKGNEHGSIWQESAPEVKLAYCQRAFAAFRGSPSQSYIISSNVQSLTPVGLCDRIDQYFSLEENIDSRLSAAAAIAPLLFADTPLGTSYKGVKVEE